MSKPTFQKVRVYAILILLLVSSFCFLTNKFQTAEAAQNIMGNTTVGSNTDTTSNPYLIFGSRFQAQATFIALYIYAFCAVAVGSSGASVVAGIYSDQSGSPGVLLGSSSAVSVSNTAQWWLFQLSVSLAVNQVYWLCLWSNAVMTYYFTVATNNQFAISNTPSSQMPTSFPGPQEMPRSESIYATDSPSTSPTPSPSPSPTPTPSPSSTPTPSPSPTPTPITSPTPTPSPSPSSPPTSSTPTISSPTPLSSSTRSPSSPTPPPSSPTSSTSTHPSSSPTTSETPTAKPVSPIGSLTTTESAAIVAAVIILAVIAVAILGRRSEEKSEKDEKYEKGEKYEKSGGGTAGMFIAVILVVAIVALAYANTTRHFLSGPVFNAVELTTIVLLVALVAIYVTMRAIRRNPEPTAQAGSNIPISVGESMEDSMIKVKPAEFETPPQPTETDTDVATGPTTQSNSETENASFTVPKSEPEVVISSPDGVDVDVTPCRCHLENMQLQVTPKPSASPSSLISNPLAKGIIVEINVQGEVTTNRKSGVVNVSGPYQVLFKANLPDGQMTQEHKGIMKLVTDMLCPEGGGVINFKDYPFFNILDYDVFDEDVRNTHGINSFTTVDAEVRVFGHVEGCDGWTFDETKKFRIDIGDYGREFYFLPSVKRILPNSQSK